MSKQFKQKDNYSDLGHRNLEVTSQESNFSYWMYEEIKPYIKGDILEIGSGFGTMSKNIIKDFPKNKIFLSEMDTIFLKELNKLKKKDVKIVDVDLTKKNDFKKLNQKFDTIYFLNVLEHIEDDILALNNVYDSLNKGGKAIVLVPAHMFLYNGIDKLVGHYRRYSKKTLLRAISKTKFKVNKLWYFNFLSIFGWYVTGNILKKTKIDNSSFSFFDKLVPLLKFFEKNILLKKLGMSIIVVLEKK